MEVGWEWRRNKSCCSHQGSQDGVQDAPSTQMSRTLEKTAGHSKDPMSSMDPKVFPGGGVTRKRVQTWPEKHEEVTVRER